MIKYALFLIFSFSHLFAMTIIYGEINELSKKDILLIIQEAKKYEIQESFEINRIRSWRNGHAYDKQYSKYVAIDFKPHKEDEFYKSYYSLFCQTPDESKWKCTRDENIRIRFDLNNSKDIIINDQKQVTIDLLVEVARAANNLRPMSWDEPITQIKVLNQENFIVTFGSIGSCTRNLKVRRYINDAENLYKIVWDELKNLNTCSSIAGYIDTSKLYVIYENGKWLSE